MRDPNVLRDGAIEASNLPPIESVSVPVSDLDVGDFVEVYDGYGEIVRIRPHFTSIGQGDIDWYTLRVRFEREPFDTACGPFRADRELECWSR